MKTLCQSPTDPGFVQDPYPFYKSARASGDLFFWQDYNLVCASSHAAVHTLLRDRRMGREIPPELTREIPARLAPFYALEANSMLELEPPRHSRLRALVTRSFTSARLVTLAPQIRALSRDMIDAFPDGPFDLLPAFASRVPIITICRMLGVPETMADQLLAWSHAMVTMYQAGRSRADEDAAASAAQDFAAFMRAHIELRRADPGPDLLSHLIAAEEAGDQLSTDELVSTCILLLNAGHEATVHGLGNAVKTLLDHNTRRIDPETVEECLRFDPPLHMFTRYVYEDLTAFGHAFKRGDKVGLLLAAAGRDPAVWSDPDRFDPTRPASAHLAFGGGIHFCVGAPLARLETTLALETLFTRCPALRLAETPSYANSYHFHGLTRLMLTTS